MSVEVDDIITYLIVKCNDETYVTAAERMTHQKGLQETITFSFEGRGVNVITST